MVRKNLLVFGVSALVLLAAVFGVALNVPTVGGNGTIYIRPDGSVEGTNKIQRFGNVYTFTDNINDSIVVEKDNITIDGAGYTLQGTGIGNGVNLVGKCNVTIKNIKITSFRYGIWLAWSSSNCICGNNITKNEYGIWLYESSNNNIYENDITANANAGVWFFESSSNNVYRNYMTKTGYSLDIDLRSSSDNNIYENNMSSIELYGSSGNRIYENKITRLCARSSSGNYIYRNNINEFGIEFNDCSGNNIYENNMNGSVINFYGSFGNYITGNNITGNNINTWDIGILLQFGSSNNIIYHNNFINNSIHAEEESNLFNVWDNGYPSGGNYWGDYVCTDIKSGLHQDTDGSDGISDTPYIINEINIDRYPLMTPWKGPGDVVPPTIDVPTRNPFGNLEGQQEVRVSVNVVDTISGVKNVTLCYTTDNWTTSSNLHMIYNKSTGLYETIIPGQPAGTFVKFKIVAYDNSGNNSTREGPEPYFEYQVIPEFASFIIVPLLTTLTLLSIALATRKSKKYSQIRN